MDSQILELKAAGVDALVLAAYSKQVSQSLRKMVDLGWKPQVYISHVSAQVHPTLSNVGLENTVGVMTAMVVKDPTDPTWQNDADYKELRRLDEEVLPERRRHEFEQRRGLRELLGDRAGAEVGRQRPEPRQHPQADHEPEGLHRADAAAGDFDDDFARQLQYLPQDPADEFDGKRWAEMGKPVGE